MTPTPCYLIPPFIADRLAVYQATPEARDAALWSAREAQALRERRARLAPLPPGEPNEGEWRRIIDAEGRQRTTGPVLREEDAPPAGDETVDNLYVGLGNFYQYYFEVHGRKGWDGAGGLMTAIARYGMTDNAAWDGEVYVSGIAQFFNAMEADGTVMAHEGTHAVDQYARNIGPYQDQSGAIKEHVADMGALFSEQWAYGHDAAHADWLIGRLLCEGKVRRGQAHPERPSALRDALYPGDAYDDAVIGRDPQPATMSGYVNTYQDNGGVHINSGILNRALTLAAIQRGGYAWQTIGRVWYEVMTVRINPTNPTFGHYAAVTMAAAADLFGTGSLEWQALRDGFAAIELEPAETSPEPEPSSPCWPEFLALLRDPVAVSQLQALARLDSVRRLAARVIPRRRS